ncbi:SSI family serine proteinase inhibitor [Streptomyces sp. NPDC058548]|uniref:SSI family serine proteinase inhibitor n=1 Tax=Streptomyces sp. NPDC058548 TaxID=3346545 RepID=UPI00364EAC9B
MNKIIPALAAAFFAATLAPAATAAAPTPTQDTRLQLTAERNVDGQDTVAFVWLDCPTSDRPAHPHRAEACAALDAAAGDFDGLRGEPDRSCTAEHSPVTFSAKGTYHGRTVDWTRTYGNNCEATVKTGPVFSF